MNSSRNFLTVYITLMFTVEIGGNEFAGLRYEQHYSCQIEGFPIYVGDYSKEIIDYLAVLISRCCTLLRQNGLTKGCLY